MGPFRVATSLKAKVEKFKIRLPIITALCTAGMKDRHWDMMSKKVKINYYLSLARRLRHLAIPGIALRFCLVWPGWIEGYNGVVSGGAITSIKLRKYDTYLCELYFRLYTAW